MIVLKNLFAASLALLSMSSNASLIEFTASGDGNIAKNWSEGLNQADFTYDPAANFFKIVFSEGGSSESISKLSFNLRAGSDSNAYFDPSDGDPDVDKNDGGMGFGPIIGSDTAGLSDTDISFSLNESSGTSHILDIFFSSNSFKVGDTFSFGIDIDQLDGYQSDIGGGLLGAQGVGIEASLGGSCVQETATVFERINKNTSTANLQFCSSQLSSASVPTPSSFFLLLAGVLAFKQSKWKGYKRSRFTTLETFQGFH